MTETPAVGCANDILKVPEKTFKIASELLIEAYFEIFTSSNYSSGHLK